MEKKMRNRTKKGIKSPDGVRYREEEPRLSGAYIRSLVKQLTTSSKPKQENEPASGICPISSDKFSDGFGEASQQSQLVKKQVRRRSHTSKPYQERLLNMAEARREIVTALKYHRAAMRQAQMEANQREFQDNPIICPSIANSTYPNYGAPSSPLSPWVPPTLDSAALPTINLPSETLGLNLNFHHLVTPNMGFFVNNTDTGFNKNLFTIPNFSSSSSSSAISHENTSRIAPTVSTTAVPCVTDLSIEISDVPMPSNSARSDVIPPLHAVLDDEEMAEIRSLGEQHQMEWNDTMNLVNSAWWFNFLNNLDVKEEGTQGKVDGPFEEFMEIPTWWKDSTENLDVTPIASPDEYEDFLQDNSFEW